MKCAIQSESRRVRPDSAAGGRGRRCPRRPWAGWLAAGAGLLLAATAGQAAVLHVDDDNLTGTETGSAVYPFRSIQEAIVQATAGDTLKVAAGAYGGIDTQGKALTILGGYAGGTAAGYAAGSGGGFSAADPAQQAAVITGGAADGVVFTRFSDAPYHAVLDGFTVRGSRRGIVCDTDLSWPQPENVQIRRNVVEDNGATNSLERGTGIVICGDHAVIAHNVIRRNHGGRGAGIFRTGDPAGRLRIETNQITDNVCYDDHGGGLMLHGNVEMTGNLVASNRIELHYGWGGGLIFHTVGTLFSAGNVYRHNHAPSYGGGVFIDEGATAELRNDVIRHNTTGEGHGGGIAVDDGYDGSSTVRVANCTVVFNNAAAPGGLGGNGVFVDNASHAMVENSIFWGHADDFHVRAGSTLAATFTLSGEGWLGAGNLQADPVFTDAAGGDYSLGAGSPAVDAGTNRAWMAGGVDAAGQPRRVNGRVDLGAFERQTGGAAPVLTLTPAAQTRSHAAGRTSFQVAISGAEPLIYTATSSRSWLRVVSGATGGLASTVHLAYSANAGGAARTGTVTVAAAGAGGSPRTYRLVQRGDPRVDLAVRNVRVTRPSNSSARTFRACRFEVRNRGPASWVGTLKAEFFLSRDSRFGNADDRKIGETTYRNVSMRPGTTRTLVLNSTRRAQAVSRWTARRVPAGNYHLYVRVRSTSAERRPADNAGRTSARFGYR
jgi:hypothetical protein